MKYTTGTYFTEHVEALRWFHDQVLMISSVDDAVLVIEKLQASPEYRPIRELMNEDDESDGE